MSLFPKEGNHTFTIMIFNRTLIWEVSSHDQLWGIYLYAFPTQGSLMITCDNEESYDEESDENGSFLVSKDNFECGQWWEFWPGGNRSLRRGEHFPVSNRSGRCSCCASASRPPGSRTSRWWGWPVITTKNMTKVTWVTRNLVILSERRPCSDERIISNMSPGLKHWSFSGYSGAEGWR